MAVLAAALTACSHGDILAPKQALRLRVPFGLTWAAYQDYGDVWHRLPVGACADLQVTDRIVLATYANTSGPGLSFYFLTADEAASRFSCDASPRVGAMELHGRNKPLPGYDWLYVMAGPSVFEHTSDTTYDLYQVPSGPVDVVATWNSGTALDALPVKKVIVRRGLTFADGDTIAPLAFDSAEAAPPDTSVLTVNALPAGTVSGAMTNLVTASGVDLPIGYRTTVGDVSLLFALPTAQRASSDLYRVSISTSGSALLNLWAYFASPPANPVVTMGPALVAPSHATLATSPMLRVRTELPYASEYSAAVTLALIQDDRSVDVTVTRAFRSEDTAMPWIVAIPEVSGVDGFDAAAWGLHDGPFELIYTVTDIPFGQSFANAHDGDVFHSAAWFSSGLTAARASALLAAMR
jgi:hypothetical protein